MTANISSCIHAVDSGQEAFVWVKFDARGSDNGGHSLKKQLDFVDDVVPSKLWQLFWFCFTSVAASFVEIQTVLLLAKILETNCHVDSSRNVLHFVHRSFAPFVSVLIAVKLY